jgi:uncharacterized RDD family membrane protein YckC
MSSMPERDAPGQWPGGTQQSAPPGDRANAPPSQGAMPGQGQFGSSPGQPPPQGGYGQPEGGGPGQWGSQPGWASPVSEAETRVTWRRIFQYWIDAFLVSIVPYLVSIPFDRSSSRTINVVGGVVYVFLFIVISLWYWVVRPHSHNGQTFAMKWFGLRVISKNGGPASATQLLVRWIGLIFDSAPWMWPFVGLLGLIVMLCSRYRQRIGDHMARTLVVATGPAYRGRSQFAGTGSGQMGMNTGADVGSGQMQSSDVGPDPQGGVR